MVWAYSVDLRERVLSAVDEGTPVYQAAKVYRVSVSFIYKLLTRRKETGQTSPSVTKGHRPRKLAGHIEALKRYVDSYNDATLQEIQAWLAGQGIRVSIGALWGTLERENLVYKKKHTRRRTGPGGRSKRPGVVADTAAGT
jgi:transposase